MPNTTRGRNSAQSYGLMPFRHRPVSFYRQTLHTTVYKKILLTTQGLWLEITDGSPFMCLNLRELVKFEDVQERLSNAADILAIYPGKIISC